MNTVARIGVETGGWALGGAALGMILVSALGPQEYSLKGAEQSVVRCADALGPVAVKDVALPPACTDYADTFGSTVTTVTVTRNGKVVRDTSSTKYDLPSATTFTETQTKEIKSVQSDETDRAHRIRIVMPIVSGACMGLAGFATAFDHARRRKSSAASVPTSATQV